MARQFDVAGKPKIELLKFQEFCGESKVSLVIDLDVRINKTIELCCNSAIIRVSSRLKVHFGPFRYLGYCFAGFLIETLGIIADIDRVAHTRCANKEVLGKIDLVSCGVGWGGAKYPADNAQHAHACKEKGFRFSS